MARRKVDPWRGANRDTATDGTFTAIRDAAQLALGRKVSIGSEAAEGHVGLPLQALCLRYFFQSTVFPLQRIVQIIGEEGSCKSTLLFEMMRWHLVHGGGGVIIENENKDATDLRHAVMQWRDLWINRCQTHPTYTLEQWQDALTIFTRLWRDTQDAPNGPGHTIPMCFGVDSIMGTAAQERAAEIEKVGHAVRGYALEANLISTYMRTMPQRIQNYPFTVIGTNHQKPSMTPTGIPTSAVPGGKSVKFYETFEIEMTKTMNKDVDTLEYSGLRLQFVLRKNSIGPSRKKITAEFLWWYVDDGAGGRRQMAAWDWDTATIELILWFENAKGKRTIYNHLQDICDINVPNKTGRRAWSKTLGIPADDPQPWRVVGAALEKRPDLLVGMHRVLGIMERQVFQPGVDYQTLMAVAEATAKEKDQQRVRELSAMAGGEAVLAANEIDDDIEETP